MRLFEKTIEISKFNSSGILHALLNMDLIVYLVRSVEFFTLILFFRELRLFYIKMIIMFLS